MQIGLRYDLRGSAATSHSRRYAAALEQCARADQAGLDYVRLNEHHGSADGYCPSPLVLAAAIGARTSRLRLRITALLLPLHDPIRVAEDIAVADLVSDGRLEVVVGAGYLPSEFAMFGRDLADRVALLEEGLPVLQRALAGEEFEYRGRRVRITPVPRPGSRPTLLLAGSSRGAARRAARIADGFEPSVPEVAEVYEREVRRLGRTDAEPRARLTSCSRVKFLHVTHDPDRAWEQIGPYALHEMNSYAQWTASSDAKSPYRPATSVDALRESGVYRILTPQECLALAEDIGPDGHLELHPLMGGMPPDLGWQSLELFVGEVLPHLPGRDGAQGAGE